MLLLIRKYGVTIEVSDEEFIRYLVNDLSVEPLILVFVLKN